MNSLQTYAESDPYFVADLLASEPSMWLAVALLREKGCDVLIPRRRVRPNVEQMAEYSDGGDIHIRYGRIKARVEVKQRPELHFTSAADFPYSTVIVDAAHLWDEASPKPLFYLIFNATMTHFCKVHSRTFPLWKRVERMDRKKNRMRWFYLCPKEVCEWHAATVTPGINS